jgi:hypothetical protein
MTTNVLTFWELKESQFLARLRKVIEESQLIHSASQLKEVLQIENTEEIGRAIQKSIRIFQKLNIDSTPHFQQVYCAQNTSISIDWRLSSFAYLLILINCDSKYPLVAKTQIELIRNQLSK